MEGGIADEKVLEDAAVGCVGHFVLLLLLVELIEDVVRGSWQAGSRITTDEKIKMERARIHPFHITGPYAKLAQGL